MATTDLISPTTPIVNGAPVSSTNPMPVYMPLGGFLPLSGGTMTGPILASAGSITDPSYSFAAQSNLGFYRRASSALSITVNGSHVAEWSATQYRVGSGYLMGFSSAAAPTAAIDTGLSRVSAGILAIGTGAAGNTGGTLRAAALAAGGSDVTITAVNVVSPTVPNRTITISYGGTTYYLAAKTTND